MALLRLFPAILASVALLFGSCDAREFPVPSPQERSRPRRSSRPNAAVAAAAFLVIGLLVFSSFAMVRAGRDDPKKRRNGNSNQANVPDDDDDKEHGKRPRTEDAPQAPPAAPVTPAIPNATSNPQQFMLLMQQMMAMAQQQMSMFQQQGATAPNLVLGGNPAGPSTSNTIYFTGPAGPVLPRTAAGPANNTAQPNRQCKVAADCGLSPEEFSSFIGGDGDQDDRRPKRAADPNAPCTEHQEKYLNDMGIMPVDIPKTYGECSALIEKHKAAYQQWRNAHGGGKPASGRQREKLVERGIDVTDDMTREEASALLEEMAEQDPPTTGQRDLLRRLQVPESEWPATKTEAHTYIAHQLEQRKRARPGQIAWIKKEAPHIPSATLSKLTAEQASNLIQQIGRQKRKSGKGCTPAKPGPKGGEGEGGSDKDGEDPTKRGTGAY